MKLIGKRHKKQLELPINDQISQTLLDGGKIFDATQANEESCAVLSRASLISRTHPRMEHLPSAARIFRQSKVPTSCISSSTTIQAVDNDPEEHKMVSENHHHHSENH